MPGVPLALHEREEIGRALMADPMASWAAVARRVRRHPSTIAREVDRGGGRGRYGPATAQRRAERATAARGGASWRFGARCGNGSPPSCAWGGPRWRSGRTSSPRTRRGGPAWRPSTRRSMTARWGCARVSVCAAAAGGGDRDNAAGQRGARRRRTSPGDQTRSTTAARAGTGKATRSSAPTTARR